MCDTNNSAGLRAAIIERNDRAPPLLRLPGEIRNEIYCYVLDEGIYTFVGGTDGTAVGPVLAARRRHALLSVCHQIYDETKLLPYSINAWTFFLFAVFETLCSRLTASQRGAIKTIRIETWANNDVSDFLLTMKQSGIGSLSQMLPGIQVARVQITAYMWMNYRASSESRKELENWLRGGTEAKVNVMIEDEYDF